MDLISTIFYFLVTIGILVLVHELGHFLAAKLTGMRIDRFSIGFPPRAFGKQIGETDYCISWIPIGGYVKIAGMIDESMDTEFVGKAPEAWEFRSKSFLAKLFVMIAGVVMNILLAVLIFWGINYSQGKFLKETTEIGYVIEQSVAQKIGLFSGDKVQEINNQTVLHWGDINSKIYIENIGKDINIKIRRNGKEVAAFVSQKEMQKLKDQPFGIYPAGSAALVSQTESGKPAEAIGMKPGNIILSIGNEKIFSSEQVIKMVKANAGKEISISWMHDKDTVAGKITPTPEGRIGVGIGTIYTGPKKQIDYSLFEAFPEGVKSVMAATGMFIQAMKQLVTGKVKFSESFGGPIKIAQMATQTAEMGWISYLAFMALLSMSLAIINIVPFPALDGGHIVFLLVEAIIRRDVPVKAKMIIQQAGFYILLAFMAFVIYNDIVNF